MKRVGQGMILSGDRHPLLLHRLQQGGLGPWARPVDFIRHQELTKNRPLDKTERPRAAAAFALIQYFRAEDIGRHKIRGELYALVVQPQHGAQRFHESGLAQPRHPDQENVTPCQERDKSFIDHLLLTEDHAPNVIADQRHSLAQRFYFGNEPGRWGIGGGGFYGGVSICHTVLHVFEHKLGLSGGLSTLTKSILDGLEGIHPQNTVGGGDGKTRFCGDIDMRISRDGVWHYQGSPIYPAGDGRFILICPETR